MKKSYYLIIAGILSAFFYACKKTDIDAALMAELKRQKAEAEAEYMASLEELEIEAYEEESVQHKIEYDISELESLPCITEFFHSEILPLGAIVTVKEETDFYITPNENFDKYSFLLIPGEKFYVIYFGMNNENQSYSGLSERHNDSGNIWVKLCNENGVEGWTLAKNLFVVKNPEAPASFKKRFSVYGFSTAAFSPDSKRVAVKKWLAHDFGDLFVIDIESAKAIAAVQDDYADSSEDVCCFSPDGNSVFYETDLNLKAFNINERTTQEYGRPFSDYALVSDMRLSKDGKQLCYRFSTNNNWDVYAVIYNLDTGFIYNLTKTEWLKHKRDFYSELEESFMDKKGYWKVNANDYYHGYAIVPEKDLVLYCVSRGDEILSGIYFFRLSTMELLKIENPFYSNWDEESDSYRDIYKFRDIFISDDRSKAGILAYGEDSRVTTATLYICDLNLDETAALPGKASIYAEDIDLYEKEAEEKAKLYINNEYFSNKRVFSLSFSNDDYYTASPGRHDGAYSGTYYITYSPVGCVLHLSDLILSNSYSDYGYEFNYNLSPKVCTILPDYDEDSDDYEYMGYWAGRPSPAGEVYYYMGEEVIKYPKDPDNLDASYYTIDNVRMRKHPDIEAEVVTISFLSNDFQSTTNRSVIPAWTYVSALAETVKQDTIDGITAPWILTMVYDPLDDWSEIYYVWIFGGYCREGRMEK